MNVGKHKKTAKMTTDCLQFIFVNKSGDEFLKAYKEGDHLLVKTNSDLSGTHYACMTLEDFSYHLESIANLMKYDNAAEVTEWIQVFVPGLPTVAVKSWDFMYDPEAQAQLWSVVENWYWSDWQSLN